MGGDVCCVPEYSYIIVTSSEHIPTNKKINIAKSETPYSSRAVDRYIFNIYWVYITSF